jgi:hypothetical protein
VIGGIKAAEQDAAASKRENRSLKPRESPLSRALDV